MTTHDHEIEESNQSQEPPWEDVPATPQEEVEAAAKKVEPTQLTMVSASAFLGQAQEPELAAKIDTLIESVQITAGADDRKMLRGIFLLIRSIATSMPWDEDEGLDARRFHLESKSVLPSWRSCIGACLQLEFLKPDNSDEVTVDTVSDEDIGAMEEATSKPAELDDEQDDDVEK